MPAFPILALYLLQIVELQNVKPACEQDLQLVHTAEHIAKIRQKAADEAPCVVADFEEPPDNVTYMTKTSYDDALKVMRRTHTATPRSCIHLACILMQSQM